MDTTIVLYHSYRCSVSTVDEVKHTEAVPMCSAEAKETFVLIFLLREILELWGPVNGSDFALPCLVRVWVITHALSYIHNMEVISLYPVWSDCGSSLTH